LSSFVHNLYKMLHKDRDGSNPMSKNGENDLIYS
jgi:hypothetical protein